MTAIQILFAAPVLTHPDGSPRHPDIVDLLNRNDRKIYTKRASGKMLAVHDSGYPPPMKEEELVGENFEQFALMLPRVDGVVLEMTTHHPRLVELLRLAVAENLDVLVLRQRNPFEFPALDLSRFGTLVVSGIYAQRSDLEIFIDAFTARVMARRTARIRTRSA